MTLFAVLAVGLFVSFYTFLAVVIVVVMARDRRTDAARDPDATYVPARWVSQYGSREHQVRAAGSNR